MTFAVPTKGLTKFLCGPKPMSVFFLLLPRSLANVLLRVALEHSCYGLGH